MEPVEQFELPARFEDAQALFMDLGFSLAFEIFQFENPVTQVQAVGFERRHLDRLDGCLREDFAGRLGGFGFECPLLPG